jgi:hypothetical protein
VTSSGFTAYFEMCCLISQWIHPISFSCSFLVIVKKPIFCRM